MRLGALDIGSNTGHLMVADIADDGRLTRVAKFAERLRLIEYLNEDQALSSQGVARLVDFLRAANTFDIESGCDLVLPFATSTIRDATNSADVVAYVAAEVGVDLRLLSGEEEAVLTYRAASEWAAERNSTRRVGVFDIGGGSLEIGVGTGEQPSAAASVPLGSTRATREWFDKGRSADDFSAHARDVLAELAESLVADGPVDRALATSATFRSLAKACGDRELLGREALRKLVNQLAGMPPQEVADLPGVSSSKAPYLAAGALVAEAVMDVFDIECLEICPWAVREGVLLAHVDDLRGQRSGPAF